MCIAYFDVEESGFASFLTTFFRFLKVFRRQKVQFLFKITKTSKDVLNLNFQLSFGENRMKFYFTFKSYEHFCKTEKFSRNLLNYWKNPEVSKVVGIVFKSSYVVLLACEVSSLWYFLNWI